MSKRRRRAEHPAQRHFAILPPYHNSGLFARHFLEDAKRLRAMAEWSRADGVQEAFDALRALYTKKAAALSRGPNESQTERSFIRPVLDILWGDDCYEVQERIPGLGIADRRPDYAFFRGAADRDAAQELSGSHDFWRNAVCLGDAKKWDAPLDRQLGAEKSPSAQISEYLYRSGVRWGILTNGRLWRLYEQDRSRPGGIFYEVDLDYLLKQGDTEPFKFFYLFFRRQAFVPDHSGLCFVDRVLQGSVQYATGIGERLKDSVYDALCHLINGFLEYEANGLDPGDPATLKLVHDNSLIVLYRLLFVLYAEDRDLLPRSERPYASYSLYHLQQEINARLHSANGYSPVAHRLWGQLCDLFMLIDRGDPDAGVPAYNGGLFGPERFPPIAHTPPAGVRRWEIGDRRLAQVIDMLAYERERWDEPGTQDVDYATLAVQHLGSIYEGLLELQPRVAQEPMVETTQKGKPLFKPAREVPSRRPTKGVPPRTVRAGEVYLVTERGERKATGSYYTPNYIVDYIVENTVGPLADEAARTVAKLRPEVDKAVRRLKRRQKQWDKEADRAPPGLSAAKGKAHLAARIEREKRRLVEPYLQLRILDPAMGSGHFLVGAADFLSMAMATDPNILPLDAMADEDPQAFFKRLIVERCLYGVDLNPLAVELAKLSLWLHTVSREKALTFLDHHLRCGNSLIGARMEEDLNTVPPQFDRHGRARRGESKQMVFRFAEALTRTELRHMLDTIQRIIEAPTGDAETERDKDHWYRDMDAARDHYRAVANLWLAPWFGVPVTADYYGRAARAVAAIGGSPAEWDALTREPWFQQAQAVARDHRFFHWELEFPEAFFNTDGPMPDHDRGFHAVIGNPPWVNLFGMADKERGYFRARYECARGKFDVYVVFVERGTELQRSYLGMVFPDRFLRSAYGKALRRTIVRRVPAWRLVGFASNDIFQDATTYPCIAIGWRDTENTGMKAARVQTGTPGQGDLTRLRFADVDVQGFEDGRGMALRGATQCTAPKRATTPLAQLVNQIGQGVYTGAKRVFVIPDPSLVEREVVKPVVEGADVRRYGPPTASSYLIYPYEITPGGLRLLDLSRYPRALEHLSSHRAALLQRRFWGETIESAGMRFYEIWNPSPFMFAPKIIYAEIASQPTFALDTGGEVACLKTCYCIVEKPAAPVPLGYLLALLNSKLLFHYLKQVSPTMRGGRHYRFLSQYVGQLPIRTFDLRTNQSTRRSAVSALTEVCAESDPASLPQVALPLISGHLRAQPERADIVHDVLVWLAEQMIEMNRAQHEETTGFLAWLKRNTGAKVDDLAGKTTLREYHEHDLATVLDILRKNRRKLDVDPSTRGFQEALQREFDASVARIAPLKQRLAWTDRLIDQIVYRLYGLTEAEIGIVEEATS